MSFFKNIIKLFIYYFLFIQSCEVFADSDIDDIVKSLDTQRLQCLESKSTNFKDYSNKDRIILIYINSILDQILSSNTNLLNTLHRSKSEFCISLDKSSSEKYTGFYSVINGLIKLSINKRFLNYIPFNTEEDLVVQICHELAHVLLKHFEKKYQIIAKIKDRYIHQSEVQPNITFTQYYLSNSDYIELIRKQEIEADNLGFLLYLNSGFDSKSYGDFFLKLEINLDPNFIKDPIKIAEEINRFRKLLKNPTIDETMDHLNVKYRRPYLDLHPSGYWRAWNVYKQEQKLLKNNNINNVNNINDINSNISLNSHDSNNTLYFRINLNGLKKIDSIKDLKFYIVQELIRNDSNIDFTIETASLDKSDTGYIQVDNSILLKAQDIFNILMLMESMKYQKHTPSCSLYFKN